MKEILTVVDVHRDQQVFHVLDYCSFLFVMRPMNEGRNTEMNIYLSININDAYLSIVCFHVIKRINHA